MAMFPVVVILEGAEELDLHTGAFYNARHRNLQTTRSEPDAQIWILPREVHQSQGSEYMVACA